MAPPETCNSREARFGTTTCGDWDANIYAWHHDGTLVSGWPFTTGSYVVSHVAVGDVDGNSYPEVVVNSNDGRLYVLSHDGVSLSGWPRQLERSWPHTGGSLYQSSPILADLNGDGRLDIVFSWDLAQPDNPLLMEWPMFQHDQQNTGRYSAAVMFIDGFETGDTDQWSATVPDPTRLEVR